MTGELSLFTSQTPTAVDELDGTGINLGMTVEFTQSMWVVGHRFYAPVTVAGTWTAFFSEITARDDVGSGGHTQLATATYSSVTPGGWNSVLYSSPVPVTPGTYYRTWSHSSSSRFTVTPNFFTGSGLANLPISAPVSLTSFGGGVLRNGTYRYNNTPAFPYESNVGGHYFQDVLAVTSLSGDAAADAMLDFLM